MTDEIREHAYKFVDWICSYLENIEDYPVKPNIVPGSILKKFPALPPNKGQPIETIFEDFLNKIIPGITHWQHPKFFAYFPANSSNPSFLAEMLTAAMGVQCMVWDTSPAATELEELVVHWLRDAMGITKDFTGVIQSSASEGTLVSMLTAREKHSNYTINQQGFYNQKSQYTIYCSEEAHSSILKATRIAGFGAKYLRNIKTNEDFSMSSEDLEQQIKDDIHKGYTPLMVIVTIGTTSSASVDSIKTIGPICNKYKLWLHVDAAYIGTTLLLPEFQYLIDGLNYIDTLVWNPHKWMFTNFDCSIYFLRDKTALLNTLSLLPEYLRTTNDQIVNNYRDWGIPLGRRFRALKLYFVINYYGIEGIQKLVRNHISLAQGMAQKLNLLENFEILTPVKFNLICFRVVPPKVKNLEIINDINKKLLTDLNLSGKMYLTHTKLRGKFCLRLLLGSTYVTKKHVKQALEEIQVISQEIISTFAQSIMD